MAEHKSSRNIKSTAKAAPKVSSVSKGGKNGSRKQRFGDSLVDEILLLVIILLAALVFVCLISDTMGPFGEGIRKGLMGLFGAGAYVFPILIIIYCLWMIFSIKKEYKILKALGGGLFLISVSAIAQSISGNNTVSSAGAWKDFIIMFSSGSGLNGGALGGIITKNLLNVIGNGTYFILWGALIISVIMGTGKSFFSGLSNTFTFFGERRRKKEARIKAKAEYIKELEAERARKQEEKELKRKKRQGMINVLLDKTEDDEDFAPFKSFSKGDEENEVHIPEAGAEDSNKEEWVEQIILDHSEAEASTDEKTELSRKAGSETEKEYRFPPTDLLDIQEVANKKESSRAGMIQTAKKLEETLKSFGVEAKVVQINRGPSITRYELSPSQGVKVSKIVNLADDIALNLAATGIRIEAPIPGKAAVGIEIPNKETNAVYLRKILESDTFKKFPSKLAFALGEDIAGNPVVADIAKMPHLLIAGATGSGKSVCINILIASILYKASPKEVKLLLVDPKVVELSVYNGIPHLLIPVVTDPKKAAGALNWAVREMLHRYQSFAEVNVRDMEGFNRLKTENGEEDLLPQIVIIIDELADLMMAAPGEVEDAICRLAQMARAAGIHLIIATQRPSVDVITGVIKANIPSRLAFSVSSGIDSRTILDMVGAEKLLGKGDMLFYPVGVSKPQRIQGAFISDKEVENIVEYIKDDKPVDYDKEMIDKITSTDKSVDAESDSDEFLDKAIELVVEKQKASVSMLQRQFRIGYNRAARLMEDLENRGIVGSEDGSKPRRVLMTASELSSMKTDKDENSEVTG